MICLTLRFCAHELLQFAMIKESKERSSRIILLFLFYLLFLIGLFSRDIRLQKLLINGNGIDGYEFKDDHVLCSDVPQCTRVGPVLIGLGFQSLILLIARMFYGNPLWQNFYLTEEQYFSVFSEMSSVLFRLICLLPVYLLVNKFFQRHFRAKLLTILALTSIFSGFPLYYLNNLFGIYITSKDYVLIFLMGIFLLHFDHILKNKYSLVIFTISCSLVMEGLPIITCVAILMSSLKILDKINRLKICFLTFIITYGSLVVIIIILNGSNTTNEFDGRYYHRNAENMLEIIGAISILTLWSFMLGLVVSFLGLTRRTNNKNVSKINLPRVIEQIEEDGIDIRNYLGVAIGFLILTIPGFFVSILTEFARQLMFFQLMMYFVGVLLSKNLKINYLKANS